MVVIMIMMLQALAKVAVRSGEPFRVQAYTVLATAAAGSIAHRSRASARGGAAPASGAAAAAAAASAAEGASADPLGVAAVAGPALEVLDLVYSGGLQRRIISRGSTRDDVHACITHHASHNMIVKRIFTQLHWLWMVKLLS